MKAALKTLGIWALGVLGLLAIVATAVDKLGGKPTLTHVKLNVDVLCDIELDLDAGRWEKEEYLVDTYKRRGSTADARLLLHVFSQSGDRALPKDCRVDPPLGSETLPTGVGVSYALVECAAGPREGRRGVDPQPTSPQRLYASVEARFLSLRIVAAGQRRSDVLAQKDELASIVRSLRLERCKGLTWPATKG